jgi:hypothetical protein
MKYRNFASKPVFLTANMCEYVTVIKPHRSYERIH